MEAHIDTDADELVSAHARTKAIGVESREDKPELLQRGDALGRHVVLRKLGAGGMGTVYLDRRATMRFDVSSAVVDDPLAAERALWQGVR